MPVKNITVKIEASSDCSEEEKIQEEEALIQRTSSPELNERQSIWIKC